MDEITKAATILGRQGGLAKSAKKTRAVRRNGKKGGRPKKIQTAKISPEQLMVKSSRQPLNQ